MIPINIKNRSRLPGIYFKTERPPPQEILPRMDIAAFIGFAESGPQQIPVSIEDMDRFREIFGGALQIAWDREKAQMQSAYLAPAVEAFFQNGGQRCWVVRATSEAQRNKFVVPGIMRSDAGQPEYARARSGGSWTDNYQIGCTLSQQPFGVKQLSFEENEKVYSLKLSAAPVSLSQGDLLRLTFPQRVLFLSVLQVVSDASGQTAICPLNQSHWFKRQYPYSALTTELQGVAEIRRPGHTVIKTDCRIHLPTKDRDRYQLGFSTHPTPVPRYGDIVQVAVDDGSQNVLLLAVSDVFSVALPAAMPMNIIRVEGSEGLWIDERANEDVSETLVEVYGEHPYADLLSFSLSVWQDQECLFRLEDLGFCKDHSRFWAELPTDEALYQLREGRKIEPTPGSMVALAAEPRFPLAGPEDPDTFYIPLGMTLLPDPQHTTPTLDDHAPITWLERNGLKVFTSDLFLDEDLKSVGSKRLHTEANYKQQRNQSNHVLQGLHSLWGIEEVTLVAIPDAVHRGWRIRHPSLPKLLEAPELNETECMQEGNAVDLIEPNEEGKRIYRRLAWNSVHGAQGYTLQEAGDPDFTQPVTHHLGPETAVSLPIDDPCPRTNYYRVRATAGAQASPWSNCCVITCPEMQFVDCSYSPLPMVTLALVEVPNGTDVLCWELADDAQIDYVLQRASDPAFESAVQIRHNGSKGWSKQLSVNTWNGVYPLTPKENDIAYYRVRSIRGEEKGPWSNTVTIAYSPRECWAMVATSDYVPDHLLMIQRAMLSFCAARGDVIAVLTMPSHYRNPDVLDHLNSLNAPYYSLTAMLEERDLSFGALYQPWLIARRTSDSGDQVYEKRPPDGAICGTMAATATSQGAWIAPANTPIIDVVSLEPSLERTDRRSLFSHQVNAICHDPSGYMVLSADTLCPLSELRPINVRRLLSLLRRLALREGRTYVFEPNSADFRHRVKYHFEQLLEDLFVRGAFAGKTPQEAYWVRVDDSVNPQTGIEAGCFVVELHVAPSQPLEFLTVRLIQQELTGLFVGEA